MMVSPKWGLETLALQHKDGNPQMAFEVSPDGSLFHSFFDKRAVKRIQTTLMPDGNVGQRFYTTDGNGSASPAVLPDGSIGHAISGKDGKNQIVLMVNGQNNLVLGVMENGEPHALYNSESVSRRSCRRSARDRRSYHLPSRWPEWAPDWGGAGRSSRLVPAPPRLSVATSAFA